ncbi:MULTISPECIES: hypothetical protein [Eubacteriales]|uniref:Transposase n=1 Tax=Dehalobacterium formicoaceticum TaxID=51515 RepID=A0ABT1Y7Z1_9FIRM|nr:hypothetical protein [Dehalobacterium formicoaceticum]MCR6547004.1 hypothetical protein [Dehalobacterium formicoaceticum]UWG97352.1 hypothetical protein LPY66_00490 [Dehalobacter sp. DCM]
MTPIEEFNKACNERAQDLTFMKANSRRIGSMHFGGIVIECLLKYIIVKHYGISQRQSIQEWVCTANTATLNNNIIICCKMKVAS